MSFRFWHSARLAPSITLNLSKSSASLSIGTRGARYTIGPRKQRLTLGLPGTGLSYSVQVPYGDGGGVSNGTADVTTQMMGGRVRDQLDPGFLRRFVMSPSERFFVDGLRALHDGQDDMAFQALVKVPEVADARWLCGMLLLKREDHEAAQAHLEGVLRQPWRLGTRIAELNLSLTVSFPVAPWVVAHAQPSEAGTLLALVEVALASRRVQSALAHLERLLSIASSDPVVTASMAELVLEQPDADRSLLEGVVALTASAENVTPIHTVLLLYRGRALTRLGLDAPAQDAFTMALRRKADRPPDLLHQIRYERALLHASNGRHAQARREFERLYAQEPDFADVRQRLEAGTGCGSG